MNSREELRHMLSWVVEEIDSNTYGGGISLATFNKARALLARTEAGADGAVMWRVEWDEDNDGDAFYVTLDTERGAMGRANEAIAEGFKGVRIRRLVYGDTHPQDASGDAERALEWLGGEMRTSTVYMNGSRAFSPSSFAMRKHDLRGRTFLEAVLNAMQAKEAK